MRLTVDGQNRPGAPNLGFSRRFRVQAFRVGSDPLVIADKTLKHTQTNTSLGPHEGVRKTTTQSQGSYISIYIVESEVSTVGITVMVSVSIPHMGVSENREP